MLNSKVHIFHFKLTYYAAVLLSVLLRDRFSLHIYPRTFKAIGLVKSMNSLHAPYIYLKRIFQRIFFFILILD